VKNPTRFFGVLSLALAVTNPAMGQQRPTGALVLIREQNVKALELTTEQQAAIRKIVDVARPKVRSLWQKAQSGGSDRGALRRQAAAVRERAMQSALALLDDRQKQAWESIRADESTPEPSARKRKRPQGGPRVLRPEDIVRVSAEEFRRRSGRRGGRFGLRVFRTEPHPVAESGYLVLTDHVDRVALDALDKLAVHRGGSVLRVGNLAALARDEAARDALRDKVRTAAPRFVAIAPRLSSYRENTVLSMWEILSHLDDDPQLDVLPGFLVASTPKSLAALVARSIAYRPVPKNDLRAFAIAEVPPDLLYKSYESSALLKKIFAAKGVSMGDLTIPSSEAIRSRSDYPEITGAGRFEIRKKNRRDLLGSFPDGVRKAIESAAMLWVLGHGKPGMACGAKVSAYTDMDLTNKIIFCGACFAASAPESDLFRSRTRPGETRGAKPEAKPRFALKAIDDGSVIVIGNMALSRGVHFMLPIVEGCLRGLTVGEAFQRLLNTQLGTEGFADAYIEKPVGRRLPRDMSPEARRANQLVNVLIGDPAIRPFPVLR
jgi:hypothetical protein